MFVVIGDIHGNFKYMMRVIKDRDIRDTTFLHVGDFGVGFAPVGVDRANLDKINTLLEEQNCHMHVIRGNHDNPYYFDGTWDWTNLHLVPDYTVVTVEGDDILMVGGAISVDRAPRKRDMLVYASQGILQESYWYDEVFVLDKKKLKDIKGVRYVVTHSCPHFCDPINDTNNGPGSHGPFVASLVPNDPKLKDDLNKERSDLTKMYELLKGNNMIDAWFYGHFHRSNAEYYEDTDFIMVNINEFREVRQ